MLLQSGLLESHLALDHFFIVFVVPTIFLLLLIGLELLHPCLESDFLPEEARLQAHLPLERLYLVEVVVPEIVLGNDLWDEFVSRLLQVLVYLEHDLSQNNVVVDIEVKLIFALFRLH